MATRVEAQTSMSVSDYDYSSFFYSSSDDPFAILDPYSEWYTRALRTGYYLFQQPMSTPPESRIEVTEGLHHEHIKLLNLASYNYLGLSSRPEVVQAAKDALEKRLLSAPCVQFCYEIAGPHDILALFDCESMAAFNHAADELLASSLTVRRYETHFVKREVKFAPFVELGSEP